PEQAHRRYRADHALVRGRVELAPHARTHGLSDGQQSQLDHQVQRPHVWRRSMIGIIGLWLACGVGGSAILAVVWTRGDGMDLTTDQLPAFTVLTILGPFWLFVAAMLALGYGAVAVWRKVLPKTKVLMRGRK